MSEPAPASSSLDLHVRAATLEALFVQAAQDMYSLVGASAKPDVILRRTLEVRGEDHASLLLAWLRELLAFTSLEDRVFYDFTVIMLSPLRLRAQLIGGLKERVERRLTIELGLEIVIRHTADGFEATIPFKPA